MGSQSENLIQIHEFKETVAIPSSVSLKRDFLSLIFMYLKQILKLFLYIFILYLISRIAKKISMIKRVNEKNLRSAALK